MTRETFEYAVLRVIPRVERGEALNAGVVVYCRQRDYLGSRVRLDVEEPDVRRHRAGGQPARRHVERDVAPLGFLG